MTKETGGPAFPSPADIYRTEMSGNLVRLKPDGFEGMTLRDWFAGQALQGLMIEEKMWRAPEGMSLAQHLAENSYSLADAMLKERSK